jgi:hypothetical protein
MPLFEYPELVFTQIALLILSGIWMLRRNDELPLLSSTFVFYIASYRYWAVTSGIDDWVKLGNFGFTPITKEAAVGALSYIVVGQICFLATYMLRQTRVLPVVVPDGDRFFFQWLRPKVIFFGLFCLPVVVVVRAQVSAQLAAGSSLAFGVSGYLYLFPMVLIGVASLILCIWKFGGLPSLRTKIAAIAILWGVAYYTFTPNSRFQFLGWMLASGIILSSSYRPKNRLIIFAMLAVVGISMFAVTGAMRNPELSGDALNQAAFERAFSAEDANMLDGFVLMQQVYPQRLDYSLGMEHLEILMRPIPRSLWPGKPVGGYMNKLGLTINGGKGTLGISQSLFGSFYAEGGLIGIIVFSVIYATILASIVRHTTQLQPFASILVRAILSACLIPLLRGGDLPGIYAWFGMAFWPCFLLLWNKRAYFALKFPSSMGVHPSAGMPLPENPYPYP